VLFTGCAVYLYIERQESLILIVFSSDKYVYVFS
jgi:hypothetical protein